MFSNDVHADFSKNAVDAIMAASMMGTTVEFGDGQIVEQITQVVECAAEVAKSSSDLATSIQNVVEAVNAAFQKDCETIKAITTPVNGFDPLSQYTEADKFVPVLEARGGTDKDAFGHRKDSMPIATAIAQSNIKSAIFQILDESDGDETAVESNDALGRFLGKIAHGIVVRINPGTLSANTQLKVDNLLRELSKNGVNIMNHPDVSSKLGAKDALVKIKHMKSGLIDTEVYYEPESFKRGFCKSIAFQPRVIKQNRGSQGEGIWICKLKDESAYNNKYGETSVSLDTELVLVEANDNHVEYHTVEEFLEWCINGRTDRSGNWTSLGNGKYFEGGVEAGAMLVDQRFLPRIVDGEVRCLMIGSELIELVHKKPKEGGVSATLQSGAIYTKYSPEDIKFKSLVDNFRSDIPNLMGAFGFADKALPLVWTADYIFGNDDDEFYIGEINCSCVGITQQLDKVDVIAKVVDRTVFDNI